MDIKNMKVTKEMLKKRVAPLAVATALVPASLGLTSCGSQSEKDPVLEGTILEDTYIVMVSDENTAECIDIVKKRELAGGYKSVISGNKYESKKNIEFVSVARYVDAEDVETLKKDGISEVEEAKVLVHVLENAKEKTEEKNSKTK